MSKPPPAAARSRVVVQQCLSASLKLPGADGYPPEVIDVGQHLTQDLFNIYDVIPVFDQLTFYIIIGR